MNIKDIGTETIDEVTISYMRTFYYATDLVNGFKGKSCSFEHREFKDRSLEAQVKYCQLANNLFVYGMKDPLITHRGHVLIGMRRFEIMSHGELFSNLFPAIEILDEVSTWTLKEIRALQKFVDEVYGERRQEFMG